MLRVASSDNKFTVGADCNLIEMFISRGVLGGDSFFSETASSNIIFAINNADKVSLSCLPHIDLSSKCSGNYILVIGVEIDGEDFRCM